eukprot:6326832-Amphidinium_carterae.2
MARLMARRTHWNITLTRALWQARVEYRRHIFNPSQHPLEVVNIPLRTASLLPHQVWVLNLSLSFIRNCAGASRLNN